MFSGVYGMGLEHILRQVTEIHNMLEEIQDEDRDKQIEDNNVVADVDYKEAE